MPYAPEIDGLRAIAVLLVVGGHIGVAGLTGGFIGVDVFFVISGYLITGQLLREQRLTGQVDLAGFYARRARRLLPGLLVMLVAVLLIGAVFLLPDEQVALAESALASLVFSANVYFWWDGLGYFATPSALLPLQHLWTLAVEEQFYLVWPLVLIVVPRVALRAHVTQTRAVLVAVAAIALLSLALSVWLGTRSPSAAFFLIPTRAWELAAGSLLAFGLPVSARWKLVLPVIGLGAIGVAAVIFDAATPFPSVNALLPIAGAAAVIAGAGAGNGYVNRILSWSPLTSVGKVSYGWYLWHWPLLAFVRIEWGAEPAVLRDFVVVIAALVIAFASFRWIELPARMQRVYGLRTTTRTLVSGAAALAVCATLTVGLWALGNGQPSRTLLSRHRGAAALLEQHREANAARHRDFATCNGSTPERCMSGAASATSAILLWGDSHAAQLKPGLDVVAKEAGVRIIERTKPSCSPGGPAPGTSECGAFNEAVLSSIPAIQREYGLRGVLIAGNWLDRNVDWNRRVEQYLDVLRGYGLRVAIARDVPAFPPNYLKCVVRRGAEACGISRLEVERQQPVSANALAQLSENRPDILLWSPLDALCPNTRCLPVDGDRLLYRNPTHLTLEGALRLVPTLAPLIAWLANPAGTLSR